MTEENKFKVGDRVNIKKSVKRYGGLEGEITRIIELGLYPYYVKLSKIGETAPFDESELEPMCEGKIFIFRK